MESTEVSKNIGQVFGRHIVLASHLCTCVLHRQLCYLHILKLPQFFHFRGDFHQKWHFAHPEVSLAHLELPFLAKSMGRHDAIFVTTGGTLGCHYHDNLRCPQWWKSRHYDNCRFTTDLRIILMVQWTSGLRLQYSVTCYDFWKWISFVLPRFK